MYVLIRLSLTQHLSNFTNWFTLSLLDSDYIAFGAHGPREPLTKPGHGLKVLVGTFGVVAASAALFYTIRQNGNNLSSLHFAMK